MKKLSHVRYRETPYPMVIVKGVYLIFKLLLFAIFFLYSVFYLVYKDGYLLYLKH